MSTVRSFGDEDTSPVHGPFTPADVREGEAITARVVSLDPNVFLNSELRVWRMSPLGIELLTGKDDQLIKGMHISLELKMGYQKSTLSGLVVDRVLEEKDQHVAHIRLVPSKESRTSDIERRDSDRWICSDQFFPTAVASNPVKFNDYLYFKIRDISFGGFKLHTSMRNKFIIPGISFECIVNFPMVSQTNMKLTVKNVRVELDGGKEVLSVGVTYNPLDDKLNKIVGNYLIQFGSVRSLEEIQNAGYLVHNVSDAIQYSYVKTKEDFEQVLRLRFDSYSAAGKIPDNKTYLDMTDQFDAKSRIILGKYKGDVVCSARMIFHQFGEELEQEKFIKWPVDLPRQDEVVEIMRACTRADFRGSDLLLGMFKYMAVTVAQAKKRWIVICATDEMIPFYQKIGFKNVGLSYQHTGLNNIVHHIMLANFVDGMAGRTVDPIHWNLVWADSVEYMSQFEMIEVDPFMQIRLTIYRWFQPITKILFERKIKKKIANKASKEANPLIQRKTA